MTCWPITTIGNVLLQNSSPLRYKLDLEVFKIFQRKIIHSVKDWSKEKIKKTCPFLQSLKFRDHLLCNKNIKIYIQFLLLLIFGNLLSKLLLPNAYGLGVAAIQRCWRKSMFQLFNKSMLHDRDSHDVTTFSLSQIKAFDNRYFSLPLLLTRSFSFYIFLGNNPYKFQPSNCGSV